MLHGDTMTPKKKLIEVALPLEAINKASAREKSIRHGHPSTLHLWWARRPLAAARAVIFSQMVDDPSEYVDVLRSDKGLVRKAKSAMKKRKKVWDVAAQLAEDAERAGITAPAPGPEPALDGILAELERERLFKIIEDLVLWENTTNEEVLQKARDEIWQSWRRACAENADHPQAKELFDRKVLPAFHDPFAGGGALPLEAQRLGLESYASDLNPVAVLINKAMIEIPPKFAGKEPVSLGARASRPHKGWHSRGYLPHCDNPGLLQSITFRLHDALPQKVVEKLAQEADSPEKRERIEALLDAGQGACWLREPRIADIVEGALLHFDGERYQLLAWCVMPNHVHVLIETREDHPLDTILHSWKSFTAKAINKTLERSGKVWQEDYHDRYIRDANHFEATIAYIEGNPVKAGLAPQAEAWTYGSAAKRTEKKEASETLALPGTQEWKGAQGLAEDVRYYGRWMRDEAEKRIGHLYPKVKITKEMIAGECGRDARAPRPDLKQYEGKELTVIAWLWARTVKSPNPAFTDVDVPLVSTFMLSTKKGKEAYVEPVIENGGYRFTVKVGKPDDVEAAKKGTKLSQGTFRCLLSNTPFRYAYIDDEANAGRATDGHCREG